VIVEVTSDAPQAPDPNDQPTAYTDLDTLGEDSGIDPDKPLVTQYTRAAVEGWYRVHTTLTEAVVSETYNLEVRRRDVYALV